jgi:hypothetical protein
MRGEHDRKSAQAKDNASYRKQVAKEAKQIKKDEKKAAKGKSK